MILWDLKGFFCFKGYERILRDLRGFLWDFKGVHEILRGVKGFYGI